MTTSFCPSCHAEQQDMTLCHKCTAALRSSLRRVLRFPGANARPPVRQAPSGPVRRVIDAYPPLTQPGDAYGAQSLPWEDQRSDWTGIDDQLTVSLARLSRRGNRNGARSTEQPLPFDLGASDAIAALRNVLATWVRDIEGDGQDWPEDTLPGMAQWLLDRMTRIRQHEAADQIKWEITGAVSHAMHMIDTVDARVLVGRCPVCNQGDVYAMPNADVGLCRKCEAVVADVQGQRSSMLASAEHRLATKPEILKAIPSMYGVEITDTRFRKWVSRGRIEARGVDDKGAQLYRVGDVLDVANGDRARSA